MNIITSTECKELFTAMSNVQAALRGAKKDSKNPFFKSNYADLESAWDACREVLAQNGFCVVQTMETDGPNDFLVTTLGHKSGQWMRSWLRLCPVKNDPQAMGSAITYARRYSLCAVVGLYQTDDDGEAAMVRGNGNTEPTHYKVPFGKYAQKTLEQIGPVDLVDYVGYLEREAIKTGKPIDPKGKVAEFIKRVEDYVGAFDNSAHV